jgi:hypothetical protein
MLESALAQELGDKDGPIMDLGVFAYPRRKGQFRSHR